MTSHRVLPYVLILCVIALCLRVPGLDRFLTPDENLWATRSAQFLAALSGGDWASTNISGHPGVTTMWAGSLGLLAKWQLDPPPESTELAATLNALIADPVSLDFLPWLRLPVILFCTLSVVAVYLLVRRIFSPGVALLGALLIGLDPFFLAHSRVLQMDALLAATLTVAWLALLAAVRTGRRRYYVYGGLSLGLALLTKSPALVIGPLMAACIVFAGRPGSACFPVFLRRVASSCLWLGLPAAITVLVFWPALWVAPLQTLSRVWGLMTTFSETGHELGNYWLGQSVIEPGRLFYVAVLLWRTTPVTLLGLFLVPAGLMSRSATGRRGAVALLLWVFWFGLVLSMGDKKFDRYLLPVFPAVDLLAAWGWITVLGRFLARRNRIAFMSFRPQAALAASGLVLVVIHSVSALSGWPTYLTAYNPMLGGIDTARRVMLVGWGEGLAEAAAYLNAQADAEDRRAAAWYGHNVFGAFYRGQSYDLYYDADTPSDLYANDVDYVVTYINQQQRAMLQPQVAARLGEALCTVTQGNVPLASVFAWPKPFAHTCDRTLGDGLRLLGWSLGKYDPAQERLPLTLYWDAHAVAAAPDAAPRTVAWIKDQSGEVWATAEGEVSRQTSQAQSGWLDRPVLAQDLTLHPPAGLLAGQYQIELAPFAGPSVILAQTQISPTMLSELQAVPRSGVPSTGEELDVRFGTAIALYGYHLESRAGELSTDLLWAALAEPPAGVQYFVHVVDDRGQIITQHDGPLARLSGDISSPETPAWRSGELVRQRVHLALPASPAPSRIYVGVYSSDTGQRLPLLAGSRPIPDARYLLHQFE